MTERCPKDEERFFAKVNFEPMSGCWLWSGATNKQCYGSFHLGKEMVLAHRFSLELHGVQIPAGLVVDHLCRVPSCVNPQHLRVCTRRENTIAPGSIANSAANAKKDNCSICGGAYSPATSGRRFCKPCAARTARIRYAQKKGLAHV